MKRDATGKFVSNWDLETKQRVSLSLTSTAWRSLDQEAHKRGISRSEVIEQFARSLEIEANAENAVLQQRIATLERQNQDLLALIENAPDAIARFDAQIRYLYVNRIVEQALGFSRDAILGKTMSEFMSDPIYHFWEEHLRQVFVTAQEQEIEFEFTTCFGVRFYQARLVPELNAQGTPISVIVISRDITQTVQAQQQRSQLLATQETQRQVSIILESITDAFVAFDSQWRYTYINHAATKILQKNPAELLGKHVWSEVFPEEVGNIAYEKLHRAMAEQAPVSWEEFGQPIQRWLEVNAYPYNEGIALYFRDVTERKQAEAERERLLHELETERAHLQAILQQMPAGILIADAATGELVIANEQAKQIVGYNYEELLQLEDYVPLTPFVAFKSDGTVYAPWEYPLGRSLSTGEIVSNEEMHLHQSDGSDTFINVNSAPILNQQNQIVAAVVVFQDITERKQAEQERQQLLERELIAHAQVQTAQRQLATLFETSPIGLALLDAQQRFIAINQALAQINGLTRKQHLGHSIPELFGQSDPQVVEVFENIYSTGNAFISPNFAVNVPGRSDRRPGYYNVYYLPTTNSHQQVEDVLIYVIDVTERVRLERGQRFLSQASTVLASSLDYETTLERVAHLAVSELADWCTVHIVEEDGSIEQIAVAHTDPAKLQWADEIRHKYPLDLDEPRGAALTLRTGQSDLLTDIPDELLVQAAHDPEHLEILRQVGFKSVMTVPLRTQARILGVISFVSAESGRQYDESTLQLAQELAHRASLAIDNAQLYRIAQRDRAQAEAANRIKDEFLAVLSHELRSPLNPILGWTKILRTKHLDATKTALALETIERNAKLQAQLIEDLLDVSRILQGKMKLNVAPVNLAAIIAAAKETVRLAAEAKNIHIHTTINLVDGSVSGDANRLQQIVWNLLSNAVKFTPSGGRVEVELKQVGMYAQIQVKDTGIGISPEFLPHVFEYFRQQDGTTTRQFGGLGLGLAIVRHLTELHGGTVEASSLGLNLGATFTVRLPLNLSQQKLSSPKNNLESKTELTNIQILVVDDDADIRELTEFILTQSGAQVITASSAAQALTLLNQSIFDVLLCDIGMPEMDGYSLIRHVRKWSAQQGGTIPAIALTAYAQEIDQQQALQAGFQKHLAKPIDPDELIKAIATLIGNW